MSSKRVLIITYYWPPSGGAGVQRWVKFVKYLREFGWEPVVYTPSNPESPAEDVSFLKDIPLGIEIIKTPIWEPYLLYKRFTGSKPQEKINAGFLTEKKKPSLAEKISVWVRGNLFIPDARKFWINPSIKFLSDYLEKNNVDAIVSTGPPHSMHLIAMGLKEKFNLPWLADFRDPWTNIDYYKDLMLTKASDRKHHELEKKVLQKADCITVVGETMKKEFQEIEKRDVEVITNGFDEDDVITESLTLDKPFSIVHVGSLNKDRNAFALWRTLKNICDENESFKKDLEIKLVGKTDFKVSTELEKNNLAAHLTKIAYLNHDEVIKVQQQSQLLLLVLNDTPNAKGILTGKLFEYLASRRPILCIGPEDGDAAEIINQTNSGVTVNFSDERKMKEIILQYYQLYKENRLSVQSRGIEQYSRKKLTQKLATILDRIFKP